MATLNNYQNTLDASYTHGYEHIVTSFQCDRPTTEVEEYYRLACKMYPFAPNDVRDMADLEQVDDLGTWHTVFKEEWTSVFYDTYMNDPEAIELLTRNERDGCISLSGLDVVTMIMHFARLMCPDLKWTVIDWRIEPR